MNTLYPPIVLVTRLDRLTTFFEDSCPSTARLTTGDIAGRVGVTAQGWPVGTRERVQYVLQSAENWRAQRLAGYEK